eukprot:1541530-Amphidinium_carterae.1
MLTTPTAEANNCMSEAHKLSQQSETVKGALGSKCAGHTNQSYCKRFHMFLLVIGFENKRQYENYDDYGYCDPQNKKNPKELTRCGGSSDTSRFPYNCVTSSAGTSAMAIGG